MGVQTLRTDSGEELVVMPRRDYDALLARLGDDDAEDRMTLLIAAEARGDKPLPAAVSAAILSGDSVLRALRNWRAMTQAELAKGTGLTQGYLSEIEARAKTGAPETLAKIAQVLKVPPGWLV